MPQLPDDLIDVIRQSDTLCLNVQDPGWDDACGYLFDEPTATLYFPVAKKYRPVDSGGFRVLIWGQPRVLATGDLLPATSEDDTLIQLELAEQRGMDPQDARHMVLDQRTMKARRTRYKLLVRELSLVPEGQLARRNTKS